MKGLIGIWIVAGALVMSVVTSFAQERTPIPTEADGAIATEIEKRLSADREVNAQTVEIDVRAGIVTLAGRVPNEDAKERAEKIARGVDGVREVHNRLTTAAGGVVAPIPDKVPNAH
jgi:hyperosmotically inducible protein